MDFLLNTLLSGNSFKDFFPGKDFFKIVDDNVEPGLYEDQMKYVNNFVNGGIDFYDNTNYLNGIKELKKAKYILMLFIPDDANVFIDTDRYTTDRVIVTETKYVNEMDIWDKPDIYNNIIKINPIFKQYIHIKNPIIEQFNNITNNTSNDSILASLINSPHLLASIKNPSFEFYIEAVKLSPKTIKYMNNLTEKNYIELIHANKDTFKYIDNPTRIICEVAVTIDGMLLKYIKNEMLDQYLCGLAFNNTVEIFPYIPVDFVTYEMCLQAVQYDGTYLEDVPNEYFDDDVIMEAIKKTPGIIKIVKEPSTKLCVEAINQDPSVVKVLENSSIKKYFRYYQTYDNQNILNTIYKILDIEPELFQYIIKPTYNICLKAVELDGHNLDDVPHVFRTEELCLKAIQSNPYAIKYIEHQTETYIINAIHTNPKCIKYITNITPEIELMAVKINGTAIKHIKSPSNELCIEAIKNNPKAIKYIPDQTYQLCMMAIGIKPSVIKYIKNQLPEICFHAINKDFRVMELINNPTLSFCKFACIIQPKALGYIKDYEIRKDCEITLNTLKELL